MLQSSIFIVPLTFAEAKKKEWDIKINKIKKGLKEKGATLVFGNEGRIIDGTVTKILSFFFRVPDENTKSLEENGLRCYDSCEFLAS